MRHFKVFVGDLLRPDVVDLARVLCVLVLRSVRHLADVAVVVGQHLVEEHLLLVVLHLVDHVVLHELQVLLALQVDVPLELLLVLLDEREVVLVVRLLFDIRYFERGISCFL